MTDFDTWALLQGALGQWLQHGAYTYSHRKHCNNYTLLCQSDIT